MTKDIFIDTDCISAFLWVGNESLLAQLYPGRVVMPKPVYDELDRPNLTSLALAKSKNGIVASNNFKDILSYINEYSLEYTTTADILVDAYDQGIIDEKQGNAIWANMLRKRRKLGAASFSDYLASHH